MSLVALALAAGCGTADTPNPLDVHEVLGAVQTWSGTMPAAPSCGDLPALERFSDDVGARAGSETRALITSAEAYREYFGHAPPAGVDFAREWVIFYAAGTQAGGYSADVNVVGACGDVLHVVTTLSGPIPPCLPPVPVPGGTTGSGGASGSGGAPSSGTANAGSASTASTVSSGPTNPGTVAPSPPATPVAPPQPSPTPPPVARPYVPYVLVKLPAQKTHSVDFQHRDIFPGCGGNPPPPPPPPSCDTILCAPGQTCVVLESYPPQVKCVGTETPNCSSTSDCATGLVCSTELGVCASNPKCAPNAPCVASCWGTCVKKSDPPPSRCTSTASCAPGMRCSTERGDCQGCGGAPGTVCPAICFGVCEPAVPTGVCTGGVIMAKGCQSEASLKAQAAQACTAAKLELRDFGVGNACFASGFTAAKYTCCDSPATPPPPPPAPVCKVDSDCRLSSNGCGQKPCTCYARAANQPQPLCAVDAVACLVDPCANLVAACTAGQCVLAKEVPPKR